MNTLLRVFASIVPELVRGVLDIILKTEIGLAAVEKMYDVRGVLKECLETVEAVITAVLPDQDGAIRVTQDELQAVLNEADDIPGAIDALLGKGGSGDE